MKTVYIIRHEINNIQCLGNILVYNEYRSLVYSNHLLERGWNNNFRNISSVPEGTYKLKLEYSHKFSKYLWEAYGIPNRSECKFHSANFWKQLNGCFSPGVAKLDINHDGNLDMIYSNQALEEFMDAMGNDIEARLVIINDKNA